MPIKGQSPKEIVHTEMHKFKHGTLHSGSKHGPLVKSRKQAIAIALSESGQSRKKSVRGHVRKYADGGEIAAKDFGDRFYPGYVARAYGETNPIFDPLHRRATDMRQQMTPATFGARWQRPNPMDIYRPQVNPFAVGGPVGSQKAPKEERSFTDMDKQGGVKEPSPSVMKDPNEVSTEEFLDREQFKSTTPEIPKRFAFGGFDPEKAESIGLARKASMSIGLIKSPIPGRTDKINTSVPSGAYIIPADVVSGMGQGNTDAGGAVLGKLMNRGPYNMNISKATAGSRVGPRHSSLKFMKVPKVSHRGGRYAAGGEIGGTTPIVAAGGEFVVHPDDVRAIGAGDLDKGHDVLDAFIKHQREKLVQKLSSLPGPKGAK